MAPDRLHYTGSDEADELLAKDPLALLIGFVLDQQVPMQKAFSGPYELKRRLGGRLDAGEIAGMDSGRLEEIFRDKPALHRFPGSMAGRVQELCRAVVSECGGDAARIWDDAKDGGDLRKRLEALPGFGPMKVRTFGGVLAKRFGIEAAQELAPDHHSLADVDSPEALERYQEAKRAYKAKLRAQQRA